MITVQFTLPVTNRKDMRQSLIMKFLEEDAGDGNGELTKKYRYNVEKIRNYAVYLLRPAFLNKGFDFTVHLQGLSFEGSRDPSRLRHQDAIDVLTKCKNVYGKDVYRNKIKIFIEKIYSCNEFTFTSPLGIFFKDSSGADHPIEIVLLAIKWLFMEQDCTYWNYSGRKMFYEKLKSLNLV